MVTKMKISTSKTIIGTGIALAVVILVPVAYWFLSAALDRAWGLERFDMTPALQILSALSILTGLFWVFWAYSYLYFVGRGLPQEVFGMALHPTRNLVTTGPYAYTRNPGVFGWIFILLGVALLEGSVSGLAMVPIVTAIAIIYLVAFEEPALKKRFGDEYMRYRSHVPVLFPRIRPYFHESPAAT